MTPDITCGNPTQPAIVQRAQSRNPNVQRPPQLLAKPAPAAPPRRASRINVLCSTAKPPAAAVPPLAAASAPVVDLLPLVAGLGAVPAAALAVPEPVVPAEPLTFDPPAAGPAAERAFTMANMPPPAWLPPAPPPVLVVQLPVVSEPSTVLLAGIGVLAVLVATINRSRRNRL